MSISFPSDPYGGQIFTDNNGKKWKYDLAKKSWKSLSVEVYTKEEIDQVVGLDSGGNYIVKGSSPNLTISDDISDIFSSLLNLEYGSVYINEVEPSEHSDGDLWFSTSDFTLRVSDSDRFKQVYPDKVANVSVSDTAPLNPNFGDLWWNSSEGTLKIYYQNSDSFLGETWTLTANSAFDDYIFYGSAFEFIEGDSANDPTITLYRGQTYNFDNQSGGHPFEIRTSDGGSAYTSGVSQSGTVTSFTVPVDAPDVLYYQCTSHPSMFGMFNIEDNLDSALDSSAEEFVSVTVLHDPIWIDVLGSNYSSSSSSGSIILDSITNGTNGINVTNNTSGYNANAIEFETDDGNTSGVRWRFTPSGHLLPSSNANFDIGSAEYKVRHLFLSDNSLTIGDTVFSEQNVDRSMEVYVGEEAPSSPTDSGKKGDVRVVDGYMYVCIETDKWVRSPIESSW